MASANSSVTPLQTTRIRGLAARIADDHLEIVYGPTVAPGPSFTNLLSVGAPGSLIANVTTLSFMSGVSFDTPAAPRQDWTR